MVGDPYQESSGKGLGNVNGYEGVVWRVKNEARLILGVDGINQAVRIEIDIDQVQFIRFKGNFSISWGITL